jgi:hypothetical protein
MKNRIEATRRILVISVYTKNRWTSNIAPMGSSLPVFAHLTELLISPIDMREQFHIAYLQIRLQTSPPTHQKPYNFHSRFRSAVWPYGTSWPLTVPFPRVLIWYWYSKTSGPKLSLESDSGPAPSLQAAGLPDIQCWDVRKYVIS